MSIARRNAEDLRAFQLERDGGGVVVRFPREFRDRVWAAEFGEVQSLLRTTSQIDTLWFDFSQCEWADPLPLLSAAIEMRRFTQGRGRAVLRLPNYEAGSPRVRQFVKFIASEGFLAELSRDAQRADGSPFTVEDLDRMARIDTELAYVKATCVRATVRRLDADAPELAERFVEDLLVLHADATARSYLPQWARDDVLYRLEIVLKEVISNIVEHGTADGEAPWAGVYVRYRQGPALQVIEHRARSERALREESDPRNCPLLKNDYWLARPACLEVFVTDAGPGMIGTMARAGVKLAEHHPFRQACEAAFCDGWSRKKNRPTPHGGLHLLSKLLGDANDYIRGLDTDSWVGFSAPLHRMHSAISEVAREDANSPAVLGLSWTFRLSWTAATDRAADGWQHWQGDLLRHPVMQALSERRDARDGPLDYSHVRFDDRRQKPLPVTSWDPADASRHLLFPPPNLTKTDILRMLGSLSAPRGSSERWILIIADIPPREAATYVAALVGRRFAQRGEPWTALLDRIVLVTEPWSVVVLQQHPLQDAVRFDIDSRATQDFLNCEMSKHPSASLDPACDLRSLAGCVRYHDSRLLWTFLEAKGAGVFVSEDVEWSPSLAPLNGYLDFAQSQSIPLALAVYDRGLRRVRGLIQATVGSPCTFEYFDRLTDVLVERANARSTTGAAPVHIGVGSVIVTGATARAGRIGTATLLDVHFFVHPTYRGDSLPHLFLWPQGSWLANRFKRPARNDGPRYARVGRTAVVAPGGWKYFPLPRYDQAGRSASACPPPDTYDDWQRPRLPFVKVGHWKYGNHHDLVGLNLDLAIRQSFLQNGPLAGFVIRHFFSQLRIRPDQLSDAGRAWYKRLALDDSEPRETPPGLIVYPSHTNTEAVIECFMILVAPELQSEIHDLMVPLRPIRRNTSGSAALVSPLAIERIRNHLHRSDLSRTVVLFDDAAITGRTQRELRQILMDAGAERVVALVLLDRLRTPGIASGRDELLHYWRFDVPTAGNAITCPVCRALAVAEELLATTVTADAKQRLRVWFDEWRAGSPVAEWNRGLESTAILLERTDKRFGLRWSETTQQFEAVSEAPISLRRSSGLVVYVTELHTMTARDDLAMSLCQEPGVPPSARMEVLITQLGLFAAEYDADIRFQMLTLALRSAASRDRPDIYTSGVALAALLEKPDVVGQALRALWEARRAAVDASQVGGTPRLNLDLELLTAHVLRHGVDIGFELPPVRRLLPSAAASFAEVLDAFHRECCSELGVVHSSALWNLRKESTWTAELVATAVDSASKMEDLIAHLHGVWAERGLSARVPLHHGRPDSLARQDSLAALRGGREALQAFHGPGSPPAATRETIETVLSIITSLHHELFLKLRVREVNAGICRPPLENALSDLASAISRDEWRIAIREKIERGQLEAARWGETTPAIRVTPSGASIPISHRGEAWVIWNATAQNCFRELMMNVLYSSQPLPDQRCDALIAVIYSPDGAIVTIENTADPIEQAERPRSGLRDALSELGIECVYSPPTAARRRFSVAVTLPFAGKLEASRKALTSRGHR